MAEKIAEKPLVSVIIPTYNRKSVISISLKSVLGQTYKNIEVIIVDDCSTDCTKTVVDCIEDPRIRYIHHSTNKGGAAARNTGIRAARGEYVAFLDSDDAWLPNKLEAQLSYILSCSNSKNAVCYSQLFRVNNVKTDVSTMDLNGKIVKPIRGKKDKEPLGNYLFCSYGMMQTSTLMLHRSLASQVGFSECLKMHQDWEFCLQLESVGAFFLFLKKPLVIRNDDPKLYHVGNQQNYKLSEKFFQMCSDYLSRHARVSFEIDKILPYTKKKRKAYCQKVFTLALLYGKYSLKTFIKASLSLWLV